MRRNSAWIRWSPHLVAALILVILIAALTIGDAITKFDYRKPFTRAGWQLPDEVIRSLGLVAGDRVADIGAGNGYFTFLLAEAVGPEGKVFAVEVSKEAIQVLEERIEEQGSSNVVAMLGRLEDPQLPDGMIDVAFLCNSYHHIDNRRAYFKSLKTDLSPQGRVAILDLKVNRLVRFFTPEGHWTTVETMESEMREAGYLAEKKLDFLPTQNFLIFSASFP